MDTTPYSKESAMNMKPKPKFNSDVDAAIRGIRANFLPRRVKVFDRTREWGGALVKAGGEAWSVSQDGTIHRLADQVGVRTSL